MVSKMIHKHAFHSVNNPIVEIVIHRHAINDEMPIT